MPALILLCSTNAKAQNNGILCETQGNGGRGYLVISNETSASYPDDETYKISQTLHEKGQQGVSLDTSEVLRVLPIALNQGGSFSMAFFKSPGSSLTYAFPRRLKAPSNFNTIQMIGSEPSTAVKDNRPELTLYGDRQITSIGTNLNGGDSIGHCYSVEPNFDKNLMQLSLKGGGAWSCGMAGVKNSNPVKDAANCLGSQGFIQTALCKVSYPKSWNFDLGSGVKASGSEIWACAQAVKDESKQIQINLPIHSLLEQKDLPTQVTTPAQQTTDPTTAAQAM